MPGSKPHSRNDHVITSRTSERVKRIVRLHSREGREKAGLFWAEGRRCVESALASNIRIEELCLSTDAAGDAVRLADAARSHGCPVVMYNRDCFAKFTAVRNPDGIGAVVPLPANRGLPGGAVKPVIMLWQLQDPGNQGSIIRSAAAMGVRHIVTVIPCVDAYHPLCARATAGQIFAVECASCDEEAARSWLEPRLSSAAVLTADGESAIETARSQIDVLVVGGESRGIPPDLRSRARSLAIPMAPGVESLNANAAAAIALYVWRGMPDKSGNSE